MPIAATSKMQMITVITVLVVLIFWGGPQLLHGFRFNKLRCVSRDRSTRLLNVRQNINRWGRRRRWRRRARSGRSFSGHAHCDGFRRSRGSRRSIGRRFRFGRRATRQHGNRTQHAERNGKHFNSDHGRTLIKFFSCPNPPENESCGRVWAFSVRTRYANHRNSSASLETVLFGFFIPLRMSGSPFFFCF